MADTNKDATDVLHELSLLISEADGCLEAAEVYTRTVEARSWVDGARKALQKANKLIAENRDG